MRNCSSVYLSLHNSDLHNNGQETTLNARDISQASHLNHLPISAKTRPASPVSLLSRIDNSEYQYFNRTGRGLVAIATGNLEPSKEHVIRIISPRVDGEEYAGMQFTGIWLNNGGTLVSPQERQMTTQPATAPDATSAPTEDLTRYPKYSGYSRQYVEKDEIRNQRGRDLNDKKSQTSFMLPQKTLEIVTDVPHTLRAQNINSSRNVLQGWQDLVGELFGVDHVSIMLNRMCVTSPCIGAAAQLANIKDAFFRRFCPRSPRFSNG